MNSNQSTTSSTPAINVHINSTVNGNFSTTFPLPNIDIDETTFIMPTLDESIASDNIAINYDVSLHSPDVILSVVNDSLASLHLQHSASDKNTDTNTGEDVIMNNNNSSFSTGYSISTYANTLSFDDVTPITYVMMTPTAPPMDECSFTNEEEYKPDLKSTLITMMRVYMKQTH